MGEPRKPSKVVQAEMSWPNTPRLQTLTADKRGWFGRQPWKYLHYTRCRQITGLRLHIDVLRSLSHAITTKHVEAVNTLSGYRDISPTEWSLSQLLGPQSCDPPAMPELSFSTSLCRQDRCANPQQPRWQRDDQASWLESSSEQKPIEPPSIPAEPGRGTVGPAR